MKKTMIFLAMLLLCLMAAPALAKDFTDDSGRTLSLPDSITRMAVTGQYAQIVGFALAPDTLVGLVSEWDAGSEAYIDEQYQSLPLLGQLYGGKGNMNLEQIALSAPQIVLDVGETKQGVAEDLDALSDQLGIPFVHIGMTVSTAPDGFRRLGELLGMEQEAEVLAAYCEEIAARVQGVMDRVGNDRARFLYCLGGDGLNVVAKGSYHAEMIDMLTDNLAVVDAPSSKGTGNAVDMEQMMIWNPDVIIFAPDSIGREAAADPAWQCIAAIANGKYAIAPALPYNFMGYPPSVQRYMGMIWMCELLYPEQSDFDLYEETARYYRLFYHCDLTREQFDALMDGAMF